jgi:hypothetical protein
MNRRNKRREVEIKFVLISQALRHEGVWRSGCIDPHIHDLGTSWNSIVTFTSLSFYARGKTTQYPLDRRLCKPQNRSGRRGEEKILEPTWTRTPTPLPSNHASHYTACTIAAPKGMIFVEFKLTTFFFFFAGIF